MEVDREPKDISELQGDGFRSAASEHSPAFTDALTNTKEPVALSRPTPSLISEVTSEAPSKSRPDWLPFR
jgi:hypothetical protein